MDFDRIDINQCPKAHGNDGPNRFADTARCKKETTEVSIIKFKRFRSSFKLFSFWCSVSLFTDGDLEGVVINVDVNQATDYRYK